MLKTVYNVHSVQKFCTDSRQNCCHHDLNVTGFIIDYEYNHHTNMYRYTDQSKVSRGAKRCAKLYRNGIGFEYKFGDIDDENIKKHWRRYDDQKAKEERVKKRRRLNDGENVDEQNIENGEEKDSELAKTKDGAATKLWTEDNKMTVFKEMIDGDYMRLEVKFRNSLLKTILCKLRSAQPQIFAALNEDRMRDMFITRKRTILKLYKEGEDLAIQSSPNSDRMILQYLKDKNIAGQAVRLKGFES